MFNLRYFDPGLSRFKEAMRATISGITGILLYWLISNHGLEQFNKIAAYVVCFITILNTQMGWSMADPGEKWHSFLTTILGSVFSLTISIIVFPYPYAIQIVMSLFAFGMFAIRRFGTQWNGPGLSMFIYCLLVYALKPVLTDISMYLFALAIAFLSVGITNSISFLRINYKHLVIDYLNLLLIDLEKPCYILTQIFQEKISYQTGSLKFKNELFKLHRRLLEVEQGEDLYSKKISSSNNFDKETKSLKQLIEIKINFIRILRSLRGANEALFRLISKDLAWAAQYRDLLLPVLNELENVILDLKKEASNWKNNINILQPFSKKLEKLRKILETMPIQDNREIFPAFRFLFSMERTLFALKQIIIERNQYCE